MTEIIKTCIDRYAEQSHELDVRLAGLKAKFWPEHQRQLHIRFFGGSNALQNRTIKTALEWEDYAEVEFIFDNHPRAQLRIAFDADQGSWSYIGTDALRVSQSEPTINFGWLTDKSNDSEIRRVVLHEFGHVLGLVHEHQSPNVTIPWNKEVVYRYYAGPPNYWNRAMVDANLFAKYEKHSVDATEFDPHSIMLYPVPNQLTLGDYEIGWNGNLSELDKQKIAELYPRVRMR